MPGPPGGRLARLSRELTQPGAMIALGDGCFRATVVLPHHAAGSWPIQLVGSIVEHLTLMCCGPKHIDVGFFVSQFLSLQRRMRIATASLRHRMSIASASARRRYSIA